MLQVNIYHLQQLLEEECYHNTTYKQTEAQTQLMSLLASGY